MSRRPNSTVMAQVGLSNKRGVPRGRLWSEAPVTRPLLRVGSTGVDKEITGYSVIRDLFYTHSLPTNHWNPYGSINLAAKDFDFGGYGFTHVYPSGLGIALFAAPVRGYVSWHMKSLDEEGYMLAPYWAYHSNRIWYPGGRPSPYAGSVRYGLVTINGTRAFAVLWDDVCIDFAPYTSSKDDRVSTFQLIAYEDGQVEYNYGRIQTDCGANSYWYDAFDQYDWEGPVVGYYLPGKQWAHTASFWRSPWKGTATPRDPVYGQSYAKQGLSGFTEGKAHDLTVATNCGIPGRRTFNLEAP